MVTPAVLPSRKDRRDNAVVRGNVMIVYRPECVQIDRKPILVDKPDRCSRALSDADSIAARKGATRTPVGVSSVS